MTAEHEETRLARELAAERRHRQKLARQLEELGRSRTLAVVNLMRRLSGRDPFRFDLSAPPSPEDDANGQRLSGSAGETTTPAMEQIFRGIFVSNLWGSKDSHSGTGSDLVQTAVIREVLPGLLRELQVSSMLDIPCGDFHWMQSLNLDVDYVGADVVPDLIERNNARYGNERRRFQVADIANDDLPRVDLVFCRDVLVHFSLADAARALANLKRSGATWLLTTTFPARDVNADITTGQWRPLNLQLPPFRLPAPVRLINEGCTEGKGEWADKSLGLWRLADL